MRIGLICFLTGALILLVFAEAKAYEIPLTWQQKADLERAITLNKQVDNLFSQRKYAEGPATYPALKPLIFSLFAVLASSQ